MSQLSFLSVELPEVHESAHRAEALANSDPRAACFYARLTLERAMTWLYRNDPALELPYQDNLAALIHEPTFRNSAGDKVFFKCRAIQTLGNRAAHGSNRITVDDAVSAVRELFHFCYWLARTYARDERPEPGLKFDPNALPRTQAVERKTLKQIKELALQAKDERERRLAAIADREQLDEEIERLRAEVAALKQASKAIPDTHDYNEAQTRDLFIDVLLKEAGWPLDQDQDREFEVTGMPNANGVGFVDYVLWGDDGKPLGLVEAKRTRRDADEGQEQAKRYADCIERQFSVRPVIFYTNGYDHWIWDDSFYPPRQIQGFYTKDELELLIQRRTNRARLATATLNEEIAGRYYQERAIRRIGESFERDRTRRALLVMATGAGKTRTVIGLSDLLQRCNWVKRVLFLADRTALVTQAVNAFKKHLPDSSPVNLVTERDQESRVYVSTYPTMIGLIDQSKESGQRRFGVGHFDLVIIDEAHRSVFNKYGAIFEYFDSLLVGLTATPKDEVDRNTYRLFELEDGMPTDAYSLQEAIADGYLVPPKAVSVPLRIPGEGIVYDDLSEEEKERFDETEWGDRAEEVIEGGGVRPTAINQWLFNQDTVDQALRHLVSRGQQVDGGDKLGKTIIFAKNHKHAKFIEERFNKGFPEYVGHFARVIDNKTEYAQALIDDFSSPSKMPQIAISVDMLDTGIDVPEIVNLVFFKQIRSKTKFWQMVGRGTRLRPDLFGPGEHKEFFYIFDYCRNLEYFSQPVEESDGSAATSLSKRLFAMRLKLLTSLATGKDGGSVVREHIAQYGEEPETEEQLREAVVSLLKAEVAAMNVSNFVVRAKREQVERFQSEEAWSNLTEEKLGELEQHIAGLPNELEPEPVERKRFDLLMLRTQVAANEGHPRFEKLKRQITEIAESLEEKSNIPLVAKQIELIQELQTEEWWQDVTLPMLERVRLRLRKMVHLIKPQAGNPVFTDFVDEMGEETDVELTNIVQETYSFERFRERAQAFLREQLDREAIQKLRLNEPLTKDDLRELEEILRESGAGPEEAVQTAAEGGLGLFVRSLVGLDREAAKTAFAEFLSDTSLNSSQIEFVNEIINYLTEHGVIEPRVLYESPFTDIHSRGPDALFAEPLLSRIFRCLELLTPTAVKSNSD